VSIIVLLIFSKDTRPRFGSDAFLTKSDVQIAVASHQPDIIEVKNLFTLAVIAILRVLGLLDDGVDSVYMEHRWTCELPL
jgi:hypothetical protein